MNPCPRCQHTEHQNKIGLTKSGSQRYRCRACGYRYTPDPKPPGYPDALR